MAERRISTPMVIASASAMAAIGVAAWLVASAPSEVANEDRQRQSQLDMGIDDRTPEAAAESFYDCWRRRRWPAAMSISTGAAQRSVLEKAARDDTLDPEERVVAERAWEALAHAPMHLRIVSSEDVGDGKLLIRAVAEYTLVNRPFQRRVRILVAPHGERWRVEDMELGEVLTELPDLLRGGGEGT